MAHFLTNWLRQLQGKARPPAVKPERAPDVLDVHHIDEALLKQRLTRLDGLSAYDRSVMSYRVRLFQALSVLDRQHQDQFLMHEANAAQKRTDDAPDTITPDDQYAILRRCALTLDEGSSLGWLNTRRAPHEVGADTQLVHRLDSPPATNGRQPGEPDPIKIRDR